MVSKFTLPLTLPRVLPSPPPPIFLRVLPTPSLTSPPPFFFYPVLFSSHFSLPSPCTFFPSSPSFFLTTHYSRLPLPPHFHSCLTFALHSSIHMFLFTSLSTTFPTLTFLSLFPTFPQSYLFLPVFSTAVLHNFSLPSTYSLKLLFSPASFPTLITPFFFHASLSLFFIHFPS